MANENSIKPKEFSEYSDQRNDYANGVELMVEITLAEYRDLVKKDALSESVQRKLRMANVELEKQVKELKDQLVALKATIAVSIKQED